MVVGTQGAVRALTPAQVRATGAEVLLANTYHLALRPGEALVEKLGGLHAFTRWDGPILTDSGGFQVFSLPNKEISDHGVRFKNELDGSVLELTPERSIEIQNALGADVIMAFDECTPYPGERGAGRGRACGARSPGSSAAGRRTRARDQALFGIVQGSTYEHLRKRCAEAVVAFDLPGYAIGGVSVGEGHELLVRITGATAPLLPETKPRYLMGVGLPEDLIAAIGLGIDLFDCVIPTRYARSASLFTRRGRIRLTQRRYRRDGYPIDTSCDCEACAGGFSRAYLHHLFAANEILSAILASVHNVRFYQRLVAEAREAIRDAPLRRMARRVPRGVRARMSALALLAGLVLSAPAPPPSPPALPANEPAIGQFLVANRQVGGFFGETVIVLVDHGAHGSLGLIVNRPVELTLAELLPDLEPARGHREHAWLGGPVAPDQLLLLIRAGVAPAGSRTGARRPPRERQPRHASRAARRACSRRRVPRLRGLRRLGVRPARERARARRLDARSRRRRLRIRPRAVRGSGRSSCAATRRFRCSLLAPCPAGEIHQSLAPHGAPLRHRRSAQRREEHALQRADRRRHRRRELPVLHDRAELGRGGGARSRASPRSTRSCTQRAWCRPRSSSWTSRAWCAARRRARASATSSWRTSARPRPSCTWCAASRTATWCTSRAASIRCATSRRSRPSSCSPTSTPSRVGSSACGAPRAAAARRTRPRRRSSRRSPSTSRKGGRRAASRCPRRRPRRCARASCSPRSRCSTSRTSTRRGSRARATPWPCSSATPRRRARASCASRRASRPSSPSSRPRRRRAFLADLGLAEPGLHRLIRAAYALLELITYFTAGEKEVKAWTIRRGTLAPQAAGVIHTDFERTFIRAEVIPFEDYVAYDGEVGRARRRQAAGRGPRVRACATATSMHFRVGA